jgi:putative copper export protein/methionine-rich copper-binding protein CopC
VSTYFRRRAALVSALAAVLVLAAAGSLWAHAALKSSNPKAGAHLAAIPREVRLAFTEAPELATASVGLVGPDSQSVSLGALAALPDSATVIVVPITGRLRAGVYSVTWKVAADDGHPVHGTFTFVIAPGAAGIATDSVVASEAVRDTAMVHHDPVAMPTSETGFDAESAAYVIIRFVLYAALLVVIGAAVFGTVVLRLLARRVPADSEQVAVSASRAAAVGAVAAWVLLVASCARLAAQAVAMHGGRASDLALLQALVTGTTWGLSWMLQTAGAVAAIAAFRLARRSRTRSSGPGAFAMLAALVLSISPAFASHAAASPRLQALAIAFDALHVFGAAGWLGSLFVVIAAGIPAALSTGDEHRARAISDLIESFSPTAFLFAAIVVASGVFAAWLHVGSFGALTSAKYGLLLVAKVAVVGVVGGIGAYNWRFVRPRLSRGDGERALRTNARAEVTVAVVVLLITAILVATPTPLDHL